MVLADNPNRDELSTRHNSTADIALNTWQYHDFIDALLDQKLTPAGLIKMKRLHFDVTLSMIATPLVMFPFAWMCNKWLQGWTSRGMASSRMNFFGMSIFYPIFLAWGYTRPLPRKLYTDVIADSGADGTYVRESLKSYKPGLWSKVSSQLNNLNFNFPEMHEFKGTSFPSNFVNFRSI